jgi:branched-chain amino acid transport system ATP-binding protein
MPEMLLEAAAPILSVENIEVIYDRVILVLKGVSLHVPEAGIVALLGANGAGKTISFKGERIDRLAPDDLVRRGCIQVMEGRHCFGHLTIEENLLTGAFTRKDGRRAVARDLEAIYAYFPRLAQKRRAQAGYTSGGEQQMCAIGRAMMSKPSMILLDEPSMGLAPQIVVEIFEILSTLNKAHGVSILLAEQNTNVALRYADYGYILESGRIVLDGAASALRDNQDVKEFYLGTAGAERKSFRDVKHYKRRKRWLM